MCNPGVPPPCATPSARESNGEAAANIFPIPLPFLFVHCFAASVTDSNGCHLLGIRYEMNEVSCSYLLWESKLLDEWHAICACQALAHVDCSLLNDGTKQAPNPDA